MFDNIIDQTNKATVESGLRQLFLEAPINMPGTQAEALSLAINNELVTIVAGHNVIRLDDGSFARNVGSLGFYVGLLANRSPQIPPHASVQNIFLNNIINTTASNNSSYKDIVSRGSVDTIYFDRGLDRYKFLNGLTTISNSDSNQLNSSRYISIVRVRLQIISDLYQNLQWTRSQPNDRTLQAQVTTSIDAYLNSKVREGLITRVGQTICGPTNNTDSDMINGRLNIQINYVPSIPADFINVNLIEDYQLISSDVTINVAA